MPDQETRYPLPLAPTSLAALVPCSHNGCPLGVDAPAIASALLAGDHPRALDLHQKLLTLWNAVIADNLPACTRYAQSLQGLPQTWPRAPMPEASPTQQAASRKALEGLGRVGRQAQAAE